MASPLARLDQIVGNAVESVVVAHHRRRLGRIGWGAALDPVGESRWADGEPDAPRRLLARGARRRIRSVAADRGGPGARRVVGAPRGVALHAGLPAAARWADAPRAPRRARGARRGSGPRLGGRAAAALQARARRRSGDARGARSRHSHPRRAGRPRAADALSPREGDRRRRQGRVRRRHRPHDARGQPAGTRPSIARAASSAGTTRRLRIDRPAARRRVVAPRASLARGDGRGARRAAVPSTPRGSSEAQLRPHRARTHLRRSLPRGEFRIARGVRPRAPERAQADLPREPVPLVAGAPRASSTAKLRRPPTDEFRLVVVLPAQPEQRERRHARAARATGRRRRATTGCSRARSTSRAHAQPVYVHAKIGIVDDALADRRLGEPERALALQRHRAERRHL